MRTLQSAVQGGRPGAAIVSAISVRNVRRGTRQGTTLFAVSTLAPTALVCVQPFALETLAGLHTFQLAADKVSTWYCFTLTVARALEFTTRAVALAVSREFPDATDVLSVTRQQQQSFDRLLSTYAVVKSAVDGAVDSLGSRKCEKLCLYPLPLVEKLLALYSPGARVCTNSRDGARLCGQESACRCCPGPWPRCSGCRRSSRQRRRK